MFARADQLLIEERQDKFPLHAIEFHWDRFKPHMECYDSRSNDTSELDLNEVRFSVSRKRTCVGYWDGEKYLRCPTQAPVEKFSQCQACSGESFLPYQDCVFDPRCEGEKCDLDFCRREHVLYLAFYDTHTKIGMSSSRRVDKRLIEQGADAFSIIGSFPNRKRAREAEKEISAKLRIPQFHRQELLLKTLARNVDRQGIESRLEGLKTTLAESHNLHPEPLKYLDAYPIVLPLAHIPELVESWGRHKGALVGIKGRWLIFESSGLKALNLSDFPARHLAREL